MWRCWPFDTGGSGTIVWCYCDWRSWLGDCWRGSSAGVVRRVTPVHRRTQCRRRWEVHDRRRPGSSWGRSATWSATRGRCRWPSTPGRWTGARRKRRRWLAPASSCRTVTTPSGPRCDSCRPVLQHRDVREIFLTVRQKKYYPLYWARPINQSYTWQLHSLKQHSI